MKIVLRICMALAFMTFFSACTHKDSISDGFCHGMYDFFNQQQRNTDSEAVPLPGNEPLTYEQYKQERQSR